MMTVVDHEPQHWFLFEEDGTLFLDAACNHSAFGYSYLIALNEDERADYARHGRAYLGELATAIHNGAPILAASRSPFKGRDLTGAYADKTSAAIDAWRQAQG